MKLQVSAIVVALLAVAFTVPGFRSSVFAALPDIDDGGNQNCGKIVCSQERASSSKDAPEMKFRPN